MKVNHKDLLWYIQNIRRDVKEDLTDEVLAEKLALWMEMNPGCIDIHGVSHPGRFHYSTVGYGVFSLMGEKYRMGRIEIFDAQDESGYAVDEGIYTMPFASANQFEDFMESFSTHHSRVVVALFFDAQELKGCCVLSNHLQDGLSLVEINGRFCFVGECP